MLTRTVLPTCLMVPTRPMRVNSAMLRIVFLHLVGLRPVAMGFSVMAGKTKQGRTPRDEGGGQAKRCAPAGAVNFGAEGAVARNADRGPARGVMRQGKILGLQGPTCRRRPYVSSHATGSDSMNGGKTRDHRHPPSSGQHHHRGKRSRSFGIFFDELDDKDRRRDASWPTQSNATASAWKGGV